LDTSVASHPIPLDVGHVFVHTGARHSVPKWGTTSDHAVLARIAKRASHSDVRDAAR